MRRRGGLPILRAPFLGAPLCGDFSVTRSINNIRHTVEIHSQVLLLWCSVDTSWGKEMFIMNDEPNNV